MEEKKEIVNEYLQSGDDELLENEVFVDSMIPLAEVSKLMENGESLPKGKLEEVRNSIEFYIGVFEDLLKAIDIMLDSMDEEEGA